MRDRSSSDASMREKRRVFEASAVDYDRWFDDHPEIYHTQQRLLKRAVPRQGRMLEIGVGSGRFAAPLGTGHGIDPSLPLARMAHMRGIEVVIGCAENLPYRDGSFDTVIMMTVICYLDNISQAFRETFRVLFPSGRIIIGFLERDGEVHRTYQAEPEKGRFLRHARFFDPDEVVRELTDSGFFPVDRWERNHGFCILTAARPEKGR